MRERRRRRNCSSAFITVAVWLAAALSVNVTALVTPSGALTRAEAWVLQRVAAGEDADLQSRFPQESDRVLSAPFLKRLLVRPPKDSAMTAYGVVISHATVRGRLDLRKQEIPHDTRCYDCRFEDEVVLIQTRFLRNVVLEGTQFLKSVDLRYLEVAGNLEANEAHFRDASFERIKVGGDVFLINAVFDAPVTFLGANVTGSLVADSASFKGEASFERISLGGYALFRKAVFEGLASFQNIVVGGALEADGARFGAGASFDGMRVQGRALFREATFEGPVTFANAEIGKVLDLFKARFTDPNDDSNFSSVKVGSSAVFSEATFAGGLWLAKADIGGNLEFDWVRATSPREKNFGGLKADVVILNGTVLTPPYWMQGVTYRLIQGESPEQLLALVTGAYGNSDLSVSLEAFYQRQGQAEAAKAVHVARRKQEREGLLRKSPVAYAWNWLQDVVAGYGQRLSRALIWSALVVFVGCVVFRRRDGMETQKAEDAERYQNSYNPFWYSLALFLPISGLEDAKVWTPKRERWKTRLYMRLHIILGYLLIPIGIAAWTGIIK